MKTLSTSNTNLLGSSFSHLRLPLKSERKRAEESKKTGAQRQRQTLEQKNIMLGRLQISADRTAQVLPQDASDATLDGQSSQDLFENELDLIYANKAARASQEPGTRKQKLSKSEHTFKKSQMLGRKGQASDLIFLQTSFAPQAALETESANKLESPKSSQRRMHHNNEVVIDFLNPGQGRKPSQSFNNLKRRSSSSILQNNEQSRLASEKAGHSRIQQQVDPEPSSHLSETNKIAVQGAALFQANNQKSKTFAAQGLEQIHIRSFLRKSQSNFVKASALLAVPLIAGRLGSSSKKLRHSVTKIDLRKVCRLGKSKVNSKAHEQDDFASEVSSSESDATTRKNAQRTKQWAKEAEEKLLKRACEQLMQMSADQPEPIKALQFKKFYPTFYSQQQSKMKEVGQRVSRMPPREERDSPSVEPEANTFKKPGSLCQVSDLTNLKDKTTSPAPKMISVRTHSSILKKQKSIQFAQAAGETKSVSSVLKTGKKSDVVRPPQNGSRKPSQPKISIQWDEANLKQTNESHQDSKDIARGSFSRNAGQSVGNSQQGRRMSQFFTATRRFSAMRDFDADFLSQSEDPESGVYDLAKMNPIQRKTFSRQIMMQSPLIKKEIYAKFERALPTSLLLSGQDKCKFEKRQLLQFFELEYRDNAGSLLLASGVVEQVFALARARNIRKRKQKKEEVVTLDDLMIYLTDNLLTNDRPKQLETAFFLYKHVAKQKVKGLARSSSKIAKNTDFTQTPESSKTGKKLTLSSSFAEQNLDALDSPWKESIATQGPSVATLNSFSGAKMQKLSEDQLLSDVDIFNILGSAAMPSLTNDCRVLLQTMKQYGFPHLNTLSQQGQDHSGHSPQHPAASNLDKQLTSRSSEGPCSTGRRHTSSMISSHRTSARTGQDAFQKVGISKEIEQEKQKLGQLKKKVLATFNRSFFASKHALQLRSSLQELKRIRSEVELGQGRRTGDKEFAVGMENLGQNFTPYKLHLIEQSCQLKNNPFYLRTVVQKFCKPQSSNKTQSRGKSAQHFSQSIQNKAVLKKYRQSNSACTLYSLIDSSPEPFITEEQQNKEDSAELHVLRERLLKKVTCPLRLKIEQKVNQEKSGGNGKLSTQKKTILKFTQIPTTFQNPSEKTLCLQPDGSFKMKKGVEKLLLSKLEQDRFDEIARTNAKLEQDLSRQVVFDKEGALRKLARQVSLQDFIAHANFQVSEGIPEIIIVCTYLVFGHKVFSFYWEKILCSREVCKIEDWPKVMPFDANYFIFCHRQISRERQENNQELKKTTVVRRNLQLPEVSFTFRTNALQHISFFRHFLNQSVSYNKVMQADGSLPKYEVHPMLLDKIDPLFSQLCDPFASYHEGIYGITLKQLTSQSELLFGVLTPHLGERVFAYLLKTQNRALLQSYAAYNRIDFRKTPRDLVIYQYWLDFCFNCVRPNMLMPFDKREIEFELLDVNSQLSIDALNVQTLDSALQFIRTASKTRARVSQDPATLQHKKAQSISFADFNQDVTASTQNEQSLESERCADRRQEWRHQPSEAEVLHSLQYSCSLRASECSLTANLEKLVSELKVVLQQKMSEDDCGSKDEQKQVKVSTQEYVQLVNRKFGPDVAPILDIITWHIFRASTKVIQYHVT